MIKFIYVGFRHHSFEAYLKKKILEKWGLCFFVFLRKKKLYRKQPFN